MTAQTPSKLDECLDLYRDGAGDVEIAAHLGMTIKQFLDLCTDNAAFKSFVEKGSTVAQAWWWKQGRKNLANKSFNPQMWAFNMKNRYGWAEKNENLNSGDMEIDINAAQVQVAQALRDLKKKNPQLAKGLGLGEDA